MKLYLTNGFHGNKLEDLIHGEIFDVPTILEFIQAWKAKPCNQAKYKIEQYNRFTFYEDYVIIDFGDYCTFIEIGNMSKSDIDAFHLEFNAGHSND